MRNGIVLRLNAILSGPRRLLSVNKFGYKRPTNGSGGGMGQIVLQQQANHPNHRLPLLDEEHLQVIAAVAAL